MLPKGIWDEKDRGFETRFRSQSNLTIVNHDTKDDQHLTGQSNT